MDAFVVWLVVWLWLACAGACANLAANKGRSWVAWLVRGLLFSIVALLWLGFLDKLDKDAGQGSGRRKRETNERRADGGPFHPAPSTSLPVSEKFLADLIAMLERDQGATMSDMCHELKVRPDVVTKAIEELRRRGLLIRRGAGEFPRFSLPKT